MEKKTVLITGGSGMVGKNLRENPSSDEFTINSPTRNEIDLRDKKSVIDYIEDCQPEIIIHCAGKVGGIQANIREPAAFLHENIEIGLNVVSAARQVGVKNLINLGSSCMYPRNINKPLVESQILSGELEPTNEGYALAKIAVARLCNYITREDNAYKYITLIPCNLYGRHDKFDPANSHLIPAVIHKVHKALNDGETQVLIWGDGNARREFMYAADLADAIFSAVKNLNTTPEILNVGIGNDYTINEYYKTVAKVLGYKGEFIHDLTRPTGMSRKLLDTSAQINWGWRPRYTLESGIKETYEFYINEYLK